VFVGDLGMRDPIEQLMIDLDDKMKVGGALGLGELATEVADLGAQGVEQRACKADPRWPCCSAMNYLIQADLLPRK